VHDIVHDGHEQLKAWRQSNQEAAFHLVKALIQRGEVSQDQNTSAIEELQVGLQKAVEPQATFLNVRGYQVPTDRRELESKLAELLRDADRPDEARQVLEDAITIRTHELGADHIQTVLAEIRLGEFLQQNLPPDQETADKLEIAFNRLRRYSPKLDGVRRRLLQLLIDVNKSLGSSVEVNRWQIELQGLGDADSQTAA
jgi:hypothetical protein